MTRRTFCAATAASAAALAAAPRTSMGVATTSYLSYWRPRDAYQVLEHCHSLGAGGIQAGLSALDPAAVSKLRSRAEQLGMYIEVMAPIFKVEAARFEEIVKAAKEAGALCLRCGCLGGRRYETFSTLADWKAFVAESHASIERVMPILARYKMRMALENHKDWTLDEFLALLKRYESPWVGVCLDTGNNLALLDDPYELVEKLAPYAFSTHIKDMGVAQSDDGFLLSELNLGDGFLDMKRILDTIRRHQPQTRMTLEMITRNPLSIPCLTDKYWATFPDRNGVFMARTLSLVRRHNNPGLPRMDKLSKEQQLETEAANVVKSLAYAREKLGLV